MTVLLDDAEVVAGTAAVAVVVLEDEAVVVLESAAEVWVVTLAVGDVVTVGPAVVVAAPERIVNPLTNPTSATTLPTSVALRARAAGCLRRLRTPWVVFMPRPSLIGLATP